MNKKHYITCPKCGGKGKITDPRALSSELRDLRVKAGLSLRQVAQAMNGMVPGYLSDMETGKREFSEEHEKEFRETVKRLARAKAKAERRKKPTATTKPATDEHEESAAQT